MQSDGTIVELSNVDLKKLLEELKAEEDPDLVEIPAAMLGELRQMNRHDRRAWHAKERKRRKSDIKKYKPAPAGANRGVTMLTPEVMEQEAQVVAEDIAGIIEAGFTFGGSIVEALPILIGRGLTTFGDVQSGLDDDANKARFMVNVLAKVLDIVIDKHLPLTESVVE